MEAWLNKATCDNISELKEIGLEYRDPAVVNMIGGWTYRDGECLYLRPWVIRWTLTDAYELHCQSCRKHRSSSVTLRVSKRQSINFQTIYPNKTYSGIFCVRIFIFPNRETNSKITDILHPQCYLKAAESLTRGLWLSRSEQALSTLWLRYWSTDRT